MRYVALLRGINVGGNNVIRMADLAEAFRAAGFSDVRTYIQSGNVVFSSAAADARALEKKIEKALSAAFSYPARALVRSLPDMERTVAGFPAVFGDASWKHNVIFLAPELDVPDVVGRFSPKPEIESLAYAPGAIFWSARLADLTRSSKLKLSARPEYKGMTVRNLNTTRKVLELMRG